MKKIVGNNLNTKVAKGAIRIVLTTESLVVGYELPAEEMTQSALCTIEREMAGYKVNKVDISFFHKNRPFTYSYTLEVEAQDIDCAIRAAIQKAKIEAIYTQHSHGLYKFLNDAYVRSYM
jgi:hypothetical protein